MKIIVVGLGKVGELLTETLAKENHDLIRGFWGEKYAFLP